MITGLFNTLAALQVVALLTAIGIVSFAVWQRHHSAMSVRRGGDAEVSQQWVVRFLEHRIGATPIGFPSKTISRTKLRIGRSRALKM
jgi:hypothetical protein